MLSKISQTQTNTAQFLLQADLEVKKEKKHMNIKVELLEGNQLEVGERKEKEEGYDALYA
jgi:hypothetical protein